MQRAMIVASLAAATLAGCTADGGEDGAIFVLKNVVAGDGCVTTATETELGISHGSLDALLPSGYLFIAQAKSRLTALAGTEDQHTILISGARVDVTFPGATLFSDTELADLKTSGLTHYRQLFTAPLTPNGGITDVGFELVPAALVEKMVQKAGGGGFRVETVATFTMEGHQAGNSVESQQFAYPITIGTGVSIVNHGACPIQGTVRPGSTCNPTQDGLVDCCTSALAVTSSNPTGLLCPGEAATGQ